MNEALTEESELGLILIIPASSASVEGPFRVLKLMKEYLQCLLSWLVVVSVERKGAGQSIEHGLHGYIQVL
jgi:hypothetical protein